jgi:hypothetical protein
MARNMLPTTAAFAGIHRNIGGEYADGVQKDWRELCASVTTERDSTKLTSLVQELIEALDKGERSWRHPIPPSDPIAANREAA